MLSVHLVSKQFLARRTARGTTEVIKALDNVSLELMPGERLGLVGESGSGKSTLARAIVGLTSIDSGSIVFDGQDVGACTAAQLRRLRARLQLVLQDPMASLDPRMSVMQLVREGLDVHATVPAATREGLVAETLERCGIGPSFFSRKPSALSGGQRQRVALARALVLRPPLMLLDEPVSALDVSVQGQILNLLLDLQDVYHVSYLFIVHDLAVARWFCDRIAVMHMGSIVECGSSAAVFDHPDHPYTKKLLAASTLHAVAEEAVL